MQEIDLETWHRKEHFNFFKNVAYPVYNICFDVDVTALKAYTHKYALSFHLAMVFQTTAALNELENFRYRLRGEQIILHDTLTPSFADISPDTDLFKMVTVDMTMDMHTFVNQAAAKSRQQTTYFVMEDFAGRDDFVFYSAIPWISFTSIDHTINLKKEDAIPRISWGKYFTKEEKLWLPFNIQVNHMFVDGVHLGIFKENLDKRLTSLQNL